MELAHHTREKATTIQSTVALNAVGKELTPSDFSAMAEAIAKMLHVRTAEMLSHIDSLVVHAATAEVLEAYIDELSTRNGSLFLAYDKATSIQGHQYGKKYSRDSYRRFVVESAIPVVYEEQDGATRGGVQETDKPTVDRALKVGQVLYWLEKYFGGGVFAMLLHNDWENL
jgi:hypothetical protein